jgi:hypothetical protein
VSLINEALRKARQAASEHDAKQPEGAFQPVKAYPSRRRGRRGGPMAGALIAVAAGVFGASAAWWFLSDQDNASGNSVTSEARLSDAAPSAPPVESPPVSEEISTETVPNQTPGKRVAVPLDNPATEQRPATETGQAIEEPARVKPVTGPNGERIFIVEADLGYASLNLGFIVARATNPFAEINDLEVHVGSEIEGFVVEAIESNRVVLRDDKGLLVLRAP